MCPPRLRIPGFYLGSIEALVPGDSPWQGVLWARIPGFYLGSIEALQETQQALGTSGRIPGFYLGSIEAWDRAAVAKPK